MKKEKDVAVQDCAEKRRASKIQRILARSLVLRDQRQSYHRDEEATQNQKHQKIIAMDIESTGLCKNSYPIEIAVVICENNSEVSQFTTIIKPTKDWLENGKATKESWGIHNIPKENLIHGIEPWKVCEVLDIMLAGENVYLSGGKWDSYWIAQLYEGRLPAFNVKNLNEFPEKELKEILDRSTKNHRALSDARDLVLAIHQIKQNQETEE